MLILDASGSMWGEVEGRPKIEIAREVLADLVASWNPAIPLGVMAYGHRRQADCGDIETVVPAAPVDAAAIVETLGGLTPTGETPLTAAVRLAAQELEHTAGPVTVILVSDGEESCAGDPCAVGADLESSGAGFTTHVIGFDLAGEGVESLRCLPESTGGLFLTAADTAGLAGALSQAREQVEQTVLPGVTLTATMTEGSPPIAERSWFYVFEPGRGGRRDKQLFYRRSAAAFFELPNGSYRVEARFPSPRGPAIASRSIEVEEGKAHHFAVALGAGTLALKTILGDGAGPVRQPPWYSVSAVQSAGRGKRRQLWREKKARPEVVLGAGRYRVEVAYPEPDGPARATAEVEVRENERTEQVMNLHAGVLALSAVQEAGAPLLKKESWYTIFPHGAKGREVDKLWKKRAVRSEVPISAGRYRIEATHPDPDGSARASAEVEIRENQRTEQVMDFRAGRVFLNAKQAGARVQEAVLYEVFESSPGGGARGDRVFMKRGPRFGLLLSEGSYVIRGRHKKSGGVAEVTVAPGDSHRVTVEMTP
jgi:Ca-activated chloride channel family protein